jgi:hypothetical protein
MSAMRDPHRNHGARLRDYQWRGHRCISIENAVLRAVFAASKGSDLIELLHKPSDTELLYQHPRGLADPRDNFSSPLSGGPFRDLFPGGWYVMLPNGPAPCDYAGASYGHHGEAAFLSYDVDVLDDRAERVEVRFTTRLRRTSLAFERRMSLTGDGATLRIEETVRNEGADAVEILWGHHPTFGGAFIEACRIHMPAATVTTLSAQPDGARLAPEHTAAWPMFPTIDGGDCDLSVGPAATERSHDFARVSGFNRGWFAVTNDRLAAGVAVRWDEGLWPLLGYWRLSGGAAGYPWWGAARMLGLEPCSDLPSLADSVARGTAITLKPGEARMTPVEATLFTPAGTVTAVDWGGVIR